VTSVVEFAYFGFELAVPAFQVDSVGPILRAEGIRDLVDPIEGVDDTEMSEFGLRVRLADGIGVIPCGPTRIRELEKSETMPLSDILRDLLSDAPHVVGAVVSPTRGFRWLIDLGKVVSVH